MPTTSDEPAERVVGIEQLWTSESARELYEYLQDVARRHVERAMSPIDSFTPPETIARIHRAVVADIEPMMKLGAHLMSRHTTSRVILRNAAPAEAEEATHQRLGARPRQVD